MEGKINRGERKFVNRIEKLSKIHRQWIWVLSDCLAYIIGTVYGLIVLYQLIQPAPINIIIYTILGTIIFLMLSDLLQLRGQINRYINLSDLLKLSTIAFNSSIIASFIVFFISRRYIFRFVLIASITTAIFVIMPRIIWQLIYTATPKRNIHNNKKQVLLFGAGDGGAYFMESYRRNPGNLEIIGILDADPAKQGKEIAGVKVLGNRYLLPKFVVQGIREVIVAIPSLEGEAYEELLTYCNQLGITVRKMPKIEEAIQGNGMTKSLPKVDIADLLGRKEVQLDETLLRQELENKTIVVTGAGGSIGSEIVRQVSRFNPRRIVLLGHGENSIYQIYHEMLKLGRMIEYVPVIADIQDKDRITQILRDEKPDLLYHAAAHKHVPLMEMNPMEALKNNILGTYNVAKAVDETGVKKMVMISSDKAVNPPNMMGASKRVAELIVTGMAKQSQSIYCAVRFGNVLGSRGSVIPLFEKQIAEGGPVTVTDFRMTRYFMTIPEASRLVIHAGAFAENGEVFVLDMGEPVKIVDLARKIILLSGYEEQEIGIVETGIRPGEKLFEELLLSSEKGDRQVNEKIFVGNVATRPLDETMAFIEKLKTSSPADIKEAIVNFANERSMSND